MKRITMILCSLLVAACAGNQPAAEQDTDTAVHCHIEGKVHNRPQSDELWLFVGIDGMVAQSSRPHTIIDIRGGVFSCDLYLDEPQYCELVFAEERANGSWRPIDFMADNCTVKFDLYPEDKFMKNRIEGTGATAEYQSYKLQLRALQDATNAIREKLKKEKRYNTNEYDALIAQIEAIEGNTPERTALIERLQAMSEEEEYTPEALAERERYNAERKATLLSIIEGEPSVARLAMLARQMIYRLPDQEFIDAFEEIYAINMPMNPMSQFCRRQIDGLNLQVGSHYVDFEAPDLDGQMHRLSEMIAGQKLVLLDLWASWCGPCRVQAMKNIPIYEKYKDKGMCVVSVARERDNLVGLEKAVAKDGYKWPVLVELDDRINLWRQYNAGDSGGSIYIIDPATKKILAINPTTEEIEALVKKYCE